MYSRLEEAVLAVSPARSQVRLAIDDELGGGAAFLEMGNRLG